MFIKSKSLVVIILFSVLTISVLTPANGANPDDGYPQGVAAPGRTCPTVAVGEVVVSEITQKSLVCTLIDGQKKWWIKGEPLPAASGGSTAKAPEILYIPKYKLPAKALAKMKVYENVTYANKTATQHLDIYMPKGVSKPPLIVWTHGGGFVIGDDDFMKFDESAKLLELFIKNGIAVASVNYRLSQEALFPAAGVDTKSAIRFLRANASKYGYDPKKFATGGDSAGSYLALMAAITADQPSPFDDPTDPNRGVSAKVSAVIDLFGNADFFEMTANNEKYPCDQSKNPFPGAPGNIHPWFGDITNAKVQADMKSAGLYPYIKSSTSLPVFYIFHGSDDCSVSPYDSKNLDAAVKAQKGKSTLKIVPGAIHGGAGVWDAVMKAVPTIKKTLISAK